MRIGIRRKIDNLGRITIPVELREEYGFKPGEKLSIVDTEDGVLIFNPDKKNENKE